MAAKYSFVTNWRVHAPIERVWPVVLDAASYPRWWKAVTRAEAVSPGDATGLGAVNRLWFRTALPYSFLFEMTAVRVEAPTLFEGRSTGDLEGMGRWTLTPQPDGTTLVRYDWNVQTNKAWMNLFAPIARPIFGWNHDIVMRWGATGLAQLLGVAVDEL